MTTTPPLALLTTGALAAALAMSPRESCSDSLDVGWGNLSLEELASTPVTLVSRRQETVWEAPAAVHVVTGDDLRRSGVTSIPEALRMVPGIQVSRIDANKWAISARGFVDRFANKLLVLVDGRSAYTPLFSGVFWEALDLPLDDVERIEVIRGPGATLWGSNAVNGVINIITKETGNTQGTHLRVGVGNEERGFGEIRYGGKLGADAHYRVYGKALERDSSSDSLGHAVRDGWSGMRTGFRIDARQSPNDQFTLQSNLLKNNIDQTMHEFSMIEELEGYRETDVDLTTFNVVGRWEQSASGAAASMLQVFFDRYDRRDRLIEETRSTVDVDFQQRMLVDARHELIWGAGYRRSEDELTGSFTLSYTPTSRAMHLFSAFAQDDIALVQDRLRLMVGTKLEHHPFTGFELQPNVRAWWNSPADRHVVWVSASRARRTPSRTDNDAQLIVARLTELDQGDLAEVDLDPSDLDQGDLDQGDSSPGFFAVVGSPDVKSEDLRAFEVGYRWRPGDRLYLAAAAFNNSYRHLRWFRLGPVVQASLPDTHNVRQAILNDALAASTNGIELDGIWRLDERLTLSGNYSYIDDSDIDFPPDRTAAHLASARVALDPTPHFHADALLRRVGRLSPDVIAAYVELDVRLAWQISAGVEISVVGQNLLSDNHPEYIPTTIRVPESQVPRALYTSLRWHR